MEESDARRRRVNRLKKMILWTVALSIVIPVVISIILGIRVHSLKMETASLKKKLSELEETLSESLSGAFSEETVETSARATEAEHTEASEASEAAETSSEAIQALDGEIEKRQVYLTFDDGPSPYTDEILDILKEYDVKATFFVVGKTDETSKAAYKRIVEDGHTLGMHSYSHKYSEIYASKDSYMEDLKTLQEYLYEETGVWCRFCRFPGGSSNTVSHVDMKELIKQLNEEDLIYYDWNVTSGDAVANPPTAERIVQNCIYGINGQTVSVVLMHDALEKKTTVEALPELIKKLRLRGDVEFCQIDDDSPVIHHLSVDS